MKKFFGLMIAVVLVLGFSGISSAITDPGANYGPVDITEATAEVYDRGDIVLMKLTVKATPNLPAVVIFESDVDDSTGTGGAMSTLGAPVPPCPCKTEPGFDVAVSIFTRQQGDISGSAIAASCSDGNGACARRREGGEWYALTSKGGQPVRALGILRGYLDPLPHSPTSGELEDCYTIPWSHILAYANAYQNENTPGAATNFDFAAARANNYTTGKWQMSGFYDATNYATDEDDVASGTFPAQTFDINDFLPDVGKADTLDSGGAATPEALTYCEGNFDGDRDVDGGDAAKFKANFGRSPFKNPCPACGPNY